MTSMLAGASRIKTLLDAHDAVANDVTFSPLLFKLLNCAEEKSEGAQTVTAGLVSILWEI